MKSLLYTFLSEKDSKVLEVLRSLQGYTGIRCMTAERRILQESPAETIAVLVSGSILSAWGLEARAELYQRVEEGSVKLIVLEDTDCPFSGQAGKMIFSNEIEDKPILGELSGTTIPVQVVRSAEKCQHAQVSMSKRRRHLISIELPGENVWRVLSVDKVGRNDMFIMSLVGCEMKTKDVTHVHLPALLPTIVCFRQIFGDQCWRSGMNHANLTIDDPWLREPYGYISYNRLLERMREVNFHTTIAFVPWNFKRSQREIADIFRKSGQHYSISVHGNNHDRYEFRGYEEVPLANQAADIYQAGLRMEEFSRLTQVPHDRVMVFPQYICPEQTVGVLKEHNYLSSANCTTIPLGGSMKNEIEHTVMPSVNEYYGFPLMKRYHPSIDRNIINVCLYLQKPMLFYIHHYFFKDSITAFDEVAQYVNSRKKGTQWTSLGMTSENLYMERVGEDKSIEVRMLSRKVRLPGSRLRGTVYRIDTSDLQIENCENVIINGNVYTGNDSMTTVLNEPILVSNEGDDLTVEICLKSPESANNSVIRWTSPKVAAIRYMSDIRDNIYPRKSRLLNRIVGR